VGAQQLVGPVQDDRTEEAQDGRGGPAVGDGELAISQASWTTSSGSIRRARTGPIRYRAWARRPGENRSTSQPRLAVSPDIARRTWAVVASLGAIGGGIVGPGVAEVQSTGRLGGVPGNSVDER
jgi:hypothetical protein